MRSPALAMGWEFRRRHLWALIAMAGYLRSEEHTSELQSRSDLVCRLLLEKKKKITPLSGTNDDQKPEWRTIPSHEPRTHAVQKTTSLLAAVPTVEGGRAVSVQVYEMSDQV